MAKKQSALVRKAPKDSAAPTMPARKSMARPDATPSKNPPQSKPYEEGKWSAAFTRAKGERRNWLIKSEPDVFSFDDLLAAKNRTTHWDGVRNTGARNFLRDGLKRGDRVFFYHSNAEPSAIAGICEVVKEGYPDSSAFDPGSDYYDAASDIAHPTWFMVDVKAIEKLKHPVTLPEIKATPALANMALLRVSRLAVVPISDEEWDTVLEMSRQA